MDFYTFELIDWIEELKYKLQDDFLCKNYSAVDFLLQNQDKIDWKSFSKNSNDKAVNLLLQNQDKIDWENFSDNCNQYAIIFLLKNPDKINWSNFSCISNPIVVNFLLQNKDKIDWDKFSYNCHPSAIELLLQNQDKINWENFSGNNSDKAISFLEHNTDKINWKVLSGNKKAIRLLLNFPSKIDKSFVLYNINAFQNDYLFNRFFKPELKEETDSPFLSFNTNKSYIDLLKANIHKINWYMFSFNSGIFNIIYDYQLIKLQIHNFKEELIIKTNHPTRIKNLLDMGIEIEDIDSYM
jgi:hypothetical protein